MVIKKAASPVVSAPKAEATHAAAAEVAPAPNVDAIVATASAFLKAAVAAKKGPTRSEARAELSQNETNKLAESLKDAPEAAKQQIAYALLAELDAAAKRGAPIAISTIALSKLTDTLGVEFKDLLKNAFFDRQAASSKVEHTVTQGLESTTTQTAQTTHDAAANKGVSDNRLKSQTAVRDALASTKAGTKLRPVGLGSDAAAYDAGLALMAHFDQRLDAKLSPELKALKHSMAPELEKLGTAVVRDIKSNPETMKRLAALRGSIGTDGFRAALKEALSGTFGSVDNALKLTRGDPTAVNGFMAAAERGFVALSKATDGTSLGKVVAERGRGALDATGKLASRLTGAIQAGDGLATTVDAAKVGADVAKAAVDVAKTTADVANTGIAVAEAGAGAASAAAAGGKAAGQAVPGLNVLLGVFSSGLALAELIGECRHKPKSAARLAAAGTNLVAQVVGVFIPGVGAVASIAKLGADATIGANEKKKGIEHAPKNPLSDVKEHSKTAAGFLATFADHAGYSDLAERTRQVAHGVDVLSEKDFHELRGMSAAQREALFQTVAAGKAEVDTVAQEEANKESPTHAVATLLGKAFSTLMGALRKAKNPETDPEGVVGEATKAAAEAATAQAAAATTTAAAG